MVAAVIVATLGADAKGAEIQFHGWTRSLSPLFLPVVLARLHGSRRLRENSAVSW